MCDPVLHLEMLYFRLLDLLILKNMVIIVLLYFRCG